MLGCHLPLSTIPIARNKPGGNPASRSVSSAADSHAVPSHGPIDGSPRAVADGPIQAIPSKTNLSRNGCVGRLFPAFHAQRDAGSGGREGPQRQVARAPRSHRAFNRSTRTRHSKQRSRKSHSMPVFSKLAYLDVSAGTMIALLYHIVCNLPVSVLQCRAVSQETCPIRHGHASPNVFRRRCDILPQNPR
jgi:hypothetical protein